MSHILKLSEWECGGRYYVGDVEELGKGSGTWWYLPNLLNLSPVDFVKMLIDKYKVSYIKYNTRSDVLIYAFDSLPAARSYKNAINKIARTKNFVICL